MTAFLELSSCIFQALELCYTGCFFSISFTTPLTLRSWLVLAIEVAFPRLGFCWHSAAFWALTSREMLARKWGYWQPTVGTEKKKVTTMTNYHISGEGTMPLVRLICPLSSLRHCCCCWFGETVGNSFVQSMFLFRFSLANVCCHVWRGGGSSSCKRNYF